MILLTLLAGMVEFGNLLNQYINLIDGAREGARFASNDDPFDVDSDGVSNYEPFFGKVYETVQGRYESGVQVSKGSINPIVLTKDNHDDIVVTFFSVTTDPSTGAKALVRFESNAGSRYNEQSTNFSDGDILGMIDGYAPNTGLILVEIFYNYHQILQFFNFGSGDFIIPLHAYSIMPLSSAEPTPTPQPTP